MNNSEKNFETFSSLNSAKNESVEATKDLDFNERELKNLIVEKHPESVEIVEQQILLNVNYLDKKAELKQGQILVHKNLASEVEEFFNFLFELNNSDSPRKFYIEKLIPIQAENYSEDDEASMSDNNSSGMNFRKIKGKEILSLHAFGFAIDLNLRENPCLDLGDNGEVKSVQPANGNRDEANLQTLTQDHPVVKWFESQNWDWGGAWRHAKDYHHFEKRLATSEYLNELQKMLDKNIISQEIFNQRLNLAKMNMENLNSEYKN